MKLRRRENRSAEGSGDACSVEPLQPQQPATLVMPDGQHLPARIAGHEHGELQVLAMVPIDGALSSDQLQLVVLEVSDGKGLTRLGGTVTAEDRELLRFRGLRPIDVVQRREYVRVRASRQVQVTLGNSAATIETHSVDLSGGGMLLSGLDHVRVGERIGFRLATELRGDSASQIIGTGKVVRSDPGGRRAVAFDSISEGDRRRLIKFLFECQREERRKGLRMEGSNGR
jgi:PilZ domain